MAKDYETPQEAMDDGVCPFCWGEGVDDNYRPCSMCDGTGEWPPPNAPQAS